MVIETIDDFEYTDNELNVINELIEQISISIAYLEAKKELLNHGKEFKNNKKVNRFIKKTIREALK